MVNFALPEWGLERKPSRESILRVRFTTGVFLCIGLISTLGFVTALFGAARSLGKALYFPGSIGGSELVKSSISSAGKYAELFIGVLSHPGNEGRRREFRKNCAPRYRAQGIQYKIFMGRPSDYVPVVSAAQGQHASPLEIEQSRKILNESL